MALASKAQVQNMIVYRSDGSTIRCDVETVDSVVFEAVPKWSNRSKEAQNLLTYLEENVGQKILTGTHACVNYNINEAKWVFKHTRKYPAINTFDFIHDIHSSSSGWINYASNTIWQNWANAGGIVSAMWHWNMLTNDSTDWKILNNGISLMRSIATQMTMLNRAPRMVTMCDVRRICASSASCWKFLT